MPASRDIFFQTRCVRPRSFRRVFVTVLLCGAAAVVAQPQPPSLPPATAVAGEPAPVRDPTPTLPSSLQVVVDGHALPAGSYGLLAQEVDGGATLLSVNADQPLNPASTMKVLTTLTALEQLGPDFTWRTEVHALGVVSEGRLQGDLLVRGSGDPFLLEEHLRNLLKALQRAGIRQIDGDLVLDTSHFAASVSDAPLIDGQADRAYNVLPHALMSNFQTVTFYFRPADDGRSVEVTAEPPLPNLRIDNRLRQQPGPCEGYQRGVRLDDDPADPQRVVLSGTFPAGCQQYSLLRSVLTPTDYFDGLFRYLWSELGGEISGGLRFGRAPDTEPLLVWQSPPLADVIKSINKFSNNMMTRQTLLTLGASEIEGPATVERGADAVAAYLDMLGLESRGLVVDNGSGLSRSTRISPALLNQVLQHGYQSPFMPEFLASLPLNGIDGTMRNRLRQNGMAGQMHVKTGSLDEVAAIAGFVRARSGRYYTVVGMLNHPLADRGPGSELLDALLAWVYQH